MLASPRKIWILAMVIAIAWIGDRATADDVTSVWVTGVGSVVMGNRDLPTSKEQALARARRAAIVAATREERVVVRDMLYRQESAAGYRELFTRLITNEVSGLIVDQHPPDFRFEEIADGELKVVCTLLAQVALEGDDADPGFQVVADFAGNESAVFRNGDDMVLRIAATRECHVTVFGMAGDGQVTVLFPNPRMTGNHLRPDESIFVPDEEQRTAEAIRFAVELPANRDAVQESIHVVATRADVPFLSLDRTRTDDGRIATYRAAYTAVNEWLAAIPAGDRASCTCLYTVVP